MFDSALIDLTFITVNDDETLNLWTPKRPADYAEATQIGRDYAAELMLVIRATGRAELFGAVIRAIGRSGIYGPVEIGFCHAIGIELIGLPHCNSIIGGNAPVTTLRSQNVA